MYIYYSQVCINILATDVAKRKGNSPSSRLCCMRVFLILWHFNFLWRRNNLFKKSVSLTLIFFILSLCVYVNASLKLLCQKINKLLACLLACLVDLFTYYNYPDKVILLKSQFLKIAKNVFLTQKCQFLIYEFKLCWYNDIDGQANILLVRPILLLFVLSKRIQDYHKTIFCHNSSRHLIFNYCYKSPHPIIFKGVLDTPFPLFFSPG